MGLAGAQDLGAIASQQASSPQTAWSANIVAPDMRGEIARNFSAGSGSDLPHCPPGQVPDATALPAVGQALSDAAPIYSCVAPPPPGPEADLAPTQGPTSKAGALLSDNARAGASLDAVSRAGASLNGSPSKAGAPLTTPAPPSPRTDEAK